MKGQDLTLLYMLPTGMGAPCQAQELPAVGRLIHAAMSQLCLHTATHTTPHHHEKGPGASPCNSHAALRPACLSSPSSQPAKC